MVTWLRRGLLTLLFMSISLGIVYYQLQNTTYADQEKDKLPDIGGPFRLVDQDGKQRADEEFRGKYMLVYFGYSYCPDVCPMGLRHMSEALKMVQSDRDKIVTLFITVDPERDDVELLKNYSQNYDPNILFLTGDKESIESVKKHYKVFAAKGKSDQTTDYLMDHSTLIYLMDKDGKFIDHFPHTVSPQVLAERLTRLLAKEQL